MRPTRDKVLLDTAFLWAERSTCSRAHVGCVISTHGRMIAQGYNGAPAGMDHCDHQCDCGADCKDYRVKFRPPSVRKYNEHHPECPAVQPCTISVHAEANAIAFAAKYGVKVEGAELHTTKVPCTNCAFLIINAGIARVVYKEDHRDMGGLTLLGAADIEILKW